MMDQLQLGEGDRAVFRSASLQLGRFLKIQPQELAFLDLSNPRAVYVPCALRGQRAHVRRRRPGGPSHACTCTMWTRAPPRRSLRLAHLSLVHSLKNFACVTVGDIIAIAYLNRTFHLKVLETKPAEAISIIETDVEVDFAPPPGYVEPTAAKPLVPATPAMAVPAPASGVGTAVGSPPTAASLERDGANKFVPFSGQGQTIRDRGRASVPSIASAPAPAPPAANRCGMVCAHGASLRRC